jgi:hypothetical protein
MSEENTPLHTEGKHKSRDTLLIAGAFLLMLVAIFTIWQFLLKGKSEEDKALNKDTIIQIKTDTVKVTDSSAIHTTKSTQTTGLKEIEHTNDSVKTFKNEKLTEEDKARLKEEFKELPKSKQDKLKRKLKTSLNK